MALAPIISCDGTTLHAHLVLAGSETDLADYRLPPLSAMLLDVPENNASKQVREFASHLAESAFINPLKGSYQLIQKSTNGVLPELEIKKTESHTTGAMLGDLAGTGLVFAGSWLLTRKAFNTVGINPNLPSSLLGKSAVSGLEMTATGTLVGALHPVDSSKDFWSSKADQTAYMAITSGLYGASWKAMSASGKFGLEGERTLKQAVAMNSTAGGAAGLFDSFLRHGIVDKRLPTSAEVAKSTAQFAVIGAGFGVAEIVAPRMIGQSWDSKPKTQAFEKEIRLNLSMDTRPDGRSTLPFSETAPKVSAESKAIVTQLTDYPLPSFSKLTTPKVSPDKAVSSAALDQSFQYVTNGVVEAKLVDGVRLATVNDSKGLTAGGLPFQRAERFIVVDRSSDPALQAVLEDAVKRFGNLKMNGEQTQRLTNYVSDLMNRHRLPAQAIDDAYVNMLNRNTDGLIPLGAFICRGTGVCLPRAALLKAIGDELGMTVRMREGFVGIKKPQSHVWTEFDLGQGYKIYDPMHPPNPLYRYVSTKH